MDPYSDQNDADQDERIFPLVNEFFERRRLGEDISAVRFAEEHPEEAVQLLPHLAALPLINSALPGVRPTDAADQKPRDGANASGAADLPVIDGYELLEEIGRGGMGVVYRALQVSTKRIVALKVVLAGPFASPSATRRFQREIELAARLQHASIVRVLEGGRVSDLQYFAMDYVPGVPLDQHLSAARPDRVTVLEGLFIPVCDAVEYAHQRGVVHRDLKPANILVDETCNPHILDFGLAKATDQADAEAAPSTRVSQPGQVVGTLFYMSPEQAAGEPDEIDARSDNYALGVMLFEALTGRLPFETTGRPSRVIQRIQEEPPIRPSSLSPQIDGDLETIILHALEKDKDRRYRTAEEMGQDIRRYLAGEPILARRQSSFYVLRKRLGKHRVAVAVAAVALAVVLYSLIHNFRAQKRQWNDARRTAVALQQDLETGADVVERAVVLTRLHPRLLEAQLIHAQALYKSERPQGGAIAMLESSLRSDPSLWSHQLLLADMYEEAGKVERAQTLRAEVDRDTSHTAESWYLRSFAALDREKALQCARQAVQIAPSHALGWRRLAHLLLLTGDLEGARQCADRLMAMGEDSDEWGKFNAKLLARQGRYQEAIAQFTRLSDYLERAHAYRRIRQYDKAVGDYTKIIQSDGERTANVWHFYQRATPLWILGRAEEALEDYARVRARLGRPVYAGARSFLILSELGRRSEAEEVLDAALRDVQDHWRRQIYRCLAREITPRELVAQARAADNLEQLCEAYYYAGEVCLQLDRDDQARQWFAKCVQTGLDYDPNTEFGTPMNEYELAQWRLESLWP